MSSVTIFQSDHFVLSTNFLFKFNISLPLVTGELLQNTIDVKCKFRCKMKIVLHLPCSEEAPR